MVEVIGVVFAIGFFGLTTQKSLLASVLSLQVMTNAAILGFAVMLKWGYPTKDISPGVVGRARDAGLLFMIFFQLQALVALAYSTRLRRQKRSTRLNQMSEMRN